MADRYDVKVKVISPKGTCTIDHKVGNEFVIGRTTPDGICLSAFNAFFPNLRVLMFGGITSLVRRSGYCNRCVPRCGKSGSF